MHNHLFIAQPRLKIPTFIAPCNTKHAIPPTECVVPLMHAVNPARDLIKYVSHLPDDVAPKNVTVTC